MSEKLLWRKLANIEKTGVAVVAAANPGCSVQLEAGARFSNRNLKIVHPISLLAQAYRSAAPELVDQRSAKRWFAKTKLAKSSKE
jgi:Fe-S oxidoreductase